MVEDLHDNLHVTPPLQDGRAVIGEQRVDPGSLAGRHRARKDKAERLASVMEGREVRMQLQSPDLHVCFQGSSQSAEPEGAPVGTAVHQQNKRPCR